MTHEIEPLAREEELTDLLRPSSWFMALLDHASAVAAPEWWIGAGAVRDLVWDERFGDGFDPANVRDVDVPFFDAADLSKERDRSVEEALKEREPNVVWDAKNQAAVHLWYPARFGIEVDPLHSVAEAVATWPETATCVAVRLTDTRHLEVLAPYGLDDLLDGIWRTNPVRVTADEALSRLRRKDPASRWPAVRIV